MQSPTQTLILRPRVQQLHDCIRPTRAEVDLSALTHNVGVLRQLLTQQASTAEIFAVIKADAYGHGAIAVARHLEPLGVGGFCVSLAEEGFELRDAGIKAPILVTSGVYGEAHAAMLRRGLTPVVYRREQLAAFALAAGASCGDVHLKIDTGMSRLGVRSDKLEELLLAWRSYPQVRMQGAMTHFASADLDAEITAEQLQRFHRAVELLRHYGHRPSVLHAANSAALYSTPAAHLQCVRPGIALFGVSPIAGLQTTLRPALRWVSYVADVRDIAAGDAVGYHTTFHASRPSRLATVAVGFGDGLPRALSNRGCMLVGGRRCPIVGRVSMDLTTLDVSESADVQVGDEVVLIGRQGGERIEVEELALAADTSTYEILTQISQRVPRAYARQASP